LGFRGARLRVPRAQTVPSALMPRAQQPPPPIDWAARLDERGYHLTATKRKDTLARWACETVDVVDEDDGKTYTEGDTVIVFDPDDPDKKLTISVGDVVYLSNNCKGKPAEIVRIEKLYTDVGQSDVASSCNVAGTPSHGCDAPMGLESPFAYGGYGPWSNRLL
jgi:hypothetical protein